MKPHEPRLDFLYTIMAEAGPPTRIGDTPHGHRVIAPIAGGSFEGPGLKGRALPGGGDWLLIRPDGVAEIDVRAALETDDGALLYVQYRGYLTNAAAVLPRWGTGEEVPREEYAFTVMPRYETSAAQYAWLQQTAVIGTGTLVRGGIRYDVFAVR